MHWRTFRRQRPATLQGWARWLFVVLLPFSAAAFDTWLNTETIRGDYRLWSLAGDNKQLAEQLADLRVEEARLEAMERLELALPGSGLVPAQPGQIEVIRYACKDNKDGSQSTLYARVQERDVSGDIRYEERMASERSHVSTSSEGAVWESGRVKTTANGSPMGDFLRKAISVAYASYRGDS